jgi:hypothetical protein
MGSYPFPFGRLTPILSQPLDVFSRAVWHPPEYKTSPTFQVMSTVLQSKFFLLFSLLSHYCFDNARILQCKIIFFGLIGLLDRDLSLSLSQEKFSLPLRNNKQQQQPQ